MKKRLKRKKIPVFFAMGIEFPDKICYICRLILELMDKEELRELLALLDEAGVMALAMTFRIREGLQVCRWRFMFISKSKILLG